MNIYLYIEKLRENQTAQNMAKNKHISLFLDSLSFSMNDPPPYLQQGGHKMSVILYIYLYIEKFKVAWKPNGSKCGKPKKHMYPIFGFFIFFVEEPPPYLQQGGVE